MESLHLYTLPFQWQWRADREQASKTKKHLQEVEEGSFSVRVSESAFDVEEEDIAALSSFVNQA